MPANNPKDMDRDEFLTLTIMLTRFVRSARHYALRISSFLGIAFLLACSVGCAPSSSPFEGKQNGSASASGELPEITEEAIRERIIGRRVREIPEENGSGEPIGWNFDEDEPNEIKIVEKQMEGERATIVLDIKTRSAPYVHNPRSIAGQIRTHWELRSGWVMRKWEIVKIENISMKYKNLPKPPPQNSNR
jgi:hypothetical protein